jgi:TetR/AcrR family transcriptional regulator
MDTRSQLLDQAVRLFAARGVDAVGIQEVVEGAGVTKPTLYHYFGSKEGLVRTLLDRGFGYLDQALDGLGPYDRDLPRYLERQAGLWIDAVKFQPDWFRVELSLTFMPAENLLAALVRPGVVRLQERMEALFVEAGRQHGNMKGRHRILAAGWFGALNHWTGIHLGGWIDTDEAFLRAGTRQFLYGIFS